MSSELVRVDEAQVAAALRDGEALPEVEESGDVARQIVERILGADDVEAIFATFQATPAQEVLGVPLLVNGVRWQRSTFSEGSPVYALLDAETGDNGERLTITCSGRSVMAALFRLQQLGAYPVRLQIQKSRNPTPEGFWPLRLARA